MPRAAVNYTIGDGPLRAFLGGSLLRSHNAIECMALEHRQEAYQLLNGSGLEIGALHEPARLPDHCTVEYCDAITQEAARALFPDRDEQFDFVIFSHVVEHLANPIRAITEVFRIVRTGGRVVIACPDKNYTFDRDRALTSYEHLWNEYENGISEPSDEHYLDFLRAVRPEVFRSTEQVLKDALAKVRGRRGHVHIWDSSSFRQFLDLTRARLGIQASCEMEHLGSQNRFEYF